MTRIYRVIKHGKTVERIDNLGPEFSVTEKELNWMVKYNQEALLHPSEKNILWYVSKTVTGDIANLGHAKGGSASVMGAALKYANKPYIVHSIDAFSKGQFNARNDDLQALGLDNVILYRGTTVDVGEELIKEGKQFDFTFIDASHVYEDVKKDWQLFSPVSNVVAFHDTNQPHTDDVINECVDPSKWELIHHVISIKVFKRI